MDEARIAALEAAGAIAAEDLTMQRLKALTWDHPRGYNALAAAAARPDLGRMRARHRLGEAPLEGFESHPIAASLRAL